MTVAVVGGGSFGRGLALCVAREGRPVVLWSRQRREIDAAGVRTTTDLSEVADAELVFLAVPSVHVGTLAVELGAHLDGSHLLVHVSRGLIGHELETLTHLLRETTPVRRVGALAGPLVARALIEGHPGGGIVGSLFPEVADAVCDAIAGKHLRIYRTDDVVGVEVASAMVGLMALALGYAQGLGFGPSTLAVLGTRGLAEAARGSDTALWSLTQGAPGLADWLADWRARIDAQPGGGEAAAARIEAVNPVYIARNHRVEEALAAAQAGDLTPTRRLLEALAAPFTPRAAFADLATPAPEDFGPYVTFCGT